MRRKPRISDQGWTSLPGAVRVRKSHPRLAACGDLDELNCCLGAARAALGLTHPLIRRTLERAQQDLLDLGALTGPGGLSEATRRLETDREALAAGLPRLRGFVLPGGSPAAAWLHVARAVCRRAERSLAALDERERLPEGTLGYINRLSSLLFAAARRAGVACGK